MPDEPNYPTVPVSFLKPAAWVHCTPALIAKRGSICATGTRRPCECGPSGKGGHDHLVPMDVIGTTEGDVYANILGETRSWKADVTVGDKTYKDVPITWSGAVKPEPLKPQPQPHANPVSNLAREAMERYLTGEFAKAFGPSSITQVEDTTDRRARLLAPKLRHELVRFEAQVGNKPVVVTNGDIQGIIREALRLIDENNVPVLVSELAPPGDSFCLVDPNATIKLARDAKPFTPAEPRHDARRWAQEQRIIDEARDRAASPKPWRTDPS